MSRLVIVAGIALAAGLAYAQPAPKPQAGGTFASSGGKPLDLPAGNSTLKVGIVRDPDDLFLVLINAPPTP